MSLADALGEIPMRNTRNARVGKDGLEINEARDSIDDEKRRQEQEDEEAARRAVMRQAALEEIIDEDTEDDGRVGQLRRKSFINGTTSSPYAQPRKSCEEKESFLGDFGDQKKLSLV